MYNKQNELMKMREKHNFSMEKLKLKGELGIEESNIKNNISLSRLRAEKEQLTVNNEILGLKNEVKKDKLIRKSGSFLHIWSIVLTVISTLLTIAGLYDVFSDNPLKLTSFILSIIGVQFSVFIIAKQSTNIKMYFSQHSFGISFLKVMLLVISIYGNYTFFTTGRDIDFIQMVIILALCFCIDCISIKLIAVSYDFKALNKNNSDNLYVGLLGKLIYNVTFKAVRNIENKYQENKEIVNKSNNSTQYITDKKDLKLLVNPSTSVIDSDSRDTSKIERLEDKKAQTSVNDSDTENASNIACFEGKKSQVAVIDSNTENESPNIAPLKKKKPQVAVNDSEVEEVLKAIFDHKDGNKIPSVTFLTNNTTLPKSKIHVAKKILDKNNVITTNGNQTTLTVDEIEEAKKLLQKSTHGEKLSPVVENK